MAHGDTFSAAPAKRVKETIFFYQKSRQCDDLGEHSKSKHKVLHVVHIKAVRACELAGLSDAVDKTDAFNPREVKWEPGDTNSLQKTILKVI